jgi:hypothetical protein
MVKMGCALFDATITTLMDNAKGKWQHIIDKL